MHFYQVLLNPL